MALDPAATVVIRPATVSDGMSITLLYHQVYGGNYPDPLMRDLERLKRFLATPGNIWMVAATADRVVGSVLYEADQEHRLARVFGGAIFPEYRGSALLEKAMALGFELLAKGKPQIEVVYATTRTSTPAAQIITEKLGYKKLGIFPNVHRTDVFETHCLAALFANDALSKRAGNFRLHPSIARLYNIVRTECDLAPLELATADDIALDAFDKTLDLELILADKFVLHRFEELKAAGVLQSHFFPFHRPNALITSPCQTLEIFVYIARADKYCTIIGVHKPREYSFTWVLEQCCTLLQDMGARYIEVIVRADKAKTIQRVLDARFIPCAYFPAFQLRGEERYDFVVCSRTSEFLDFRNLKLTGLNMVYLEEYLHQLQDAYLKPKAHGKTV